MIVNSDWLKPKIKPYLHQISQDCISEIAVYIENNNIEEVDCDTCLIMQEVLSDEIEDEEFFDFSIENLEKLISYIADGNLNIRIHRDISGEIWFGVDKE
ncbi:MAG: hypothetical protein QGI94_02050 [Candidatus Scalindua sp.]|jgi:uncharacterized membrane protein YheB (UPF0754 family)|nr:hypothetical protein [Candidatus Scalindua sp.]